MMRAQAIYNVYPAVVSTIGDESFDKDGNTVTLDESAITTEVAKLQTEFDALQYQRDRQYPELREQLDMLFHDMTADKGTKDGEWYKAVAKVKEDNPKPDGWKE